MVSFRMIFYFIFGVVMLYAIEKMHEKMAISDNEKLKYRYEIRFVLNTHSDVQLELYSNYPYSNISEFLNGKFIAKEKNVYRFESHGKSYMLNKSDIVLIEFYGEENPDGERQKTMFESLKERTQFWRAKK